MFAFWPFDFSCSGITCVMLLLLAWIGMAIGQATRTATNVAKKVVNNEAVQEAGKGIFAAWLESKFRN